MKNLIALVSFLFISASVCGQVFPTNEYNYYVDAAVEQSAPAEYVFRTVNEALLAAESVQREREFSEEQPLTIRIAPSVYWIDDPDDPEVRLPQPGREPYGMELRLGHLRLVGLSDNPQDVVLACNRGQTQGAAGNFTMFFFWGSDIRAENLTFGNYCNVDLDYPLNPALNRKRRADAIVQAQLVLCKGDKMVARNCRFISRLNACPFCGADRALFEDCYFECTDDALCGTGVYLNCRFTLFSGKPFYATQGTGAVFLNCDLHSKVTGRQYLVKAGSPVAMVDCRWTSDMPDLYIGWTQDPTDDQRSYQHNVTLNGSPILIDRDRPWLTVDMTGKDVLKAYKFDTIYNIENLLGFTPLPTGEGLGERLPTQLCLSHRSAIIESGVDTLRIGAELLAPFVGTLSGASYGRTNSERGSKTQPKTHQDASIHSGTDIHWKISPQDAAYVSLTTDEQGRCTVWGTNQEEQPRTVNLLATTDSGLESACVLTVLPRQLPAPAFVRQPVIRQESNQLIADYQLDLGNRADQSLITWHRCTSPADANAIPVAVSRLNQPLQQYALTPADNGYYLRATIEPKHLRSHTGEAVSATTDSPIIYKGKETVLVTEFQNFPTDYQPRIIPGFWTVDGYKPADTQAYDWKPDTLAWFYGKGVDAAARSVGLQQACRGARLLYTPLAGEYGDMVLILTVDPCKSAGQGFGSATGQYMDICIKFDTQTLTGYALRIVRTTKNDHAVDFLLMKYADGIATPITEAVTSTCYRTGCTIQMKAEGNRLTAHAVRQGEEVNLQATITPNTYGGIGIQHTGSTGPSGTLLKALSVEWAHDEETSDYYQKGYDRGYDDGEDDAVSGNGWYGQFDDTNTYKGKQKLDYESGYAEGYEAGYDDNYEQADE